MFRQVLKRLKKQGKAARRSYPSVLDDPNLSFSDLKAIWRSSIEIENNAGNHRNED